MKLRRRQYSWSFMAWDIGLAQAQLSGTINVSCQEDSIRFSVKRGMAVQCKQAARCERCEVQVGSSWDMGGYRQRYKPGY
ncbi:hypothetical protein RRG08_012558 [Elysia crispata]|uniref:Uncharacterized protein n=1 Tax=Elysia crispata TaxID=231223 RepID=A0AAE1AQD7_9GAST|nr:hypothetical protein RRG08_012558 [Elysia crispata]